MASMNVRSALSEMWDCSC